ncbi:PilW family protein [Hydrogenophaga sp. PBL-H3]|uniref:PilW family protein n=1 Tax=Hydrogenophaga sp. PBL-H3 TaxID=434010 RepID=UPI00135AF0F7|nr:PilW family protein [Hydrogenophaga sp. PBL-H3]
MKQQNPIRRGQHGVTLIELMVSIAIGLFLVVGLATLFSQQSGARRSIDNTGKLIENGRYAMFVLSKDIQLAGYLGELTVPPAAPAAVPNPCLLTVAELESAMPLQLQGFNNPAGAAVPACVTNHRAGTDIVVVRRADVAPVALGAAQAGHVYLQTGVIAPLSTVFNYRFNQAPSATFDLRLKDGLTVSPLRRYITHIYFVSTCSDPGADGVCGAGDDTIPTLKRLEITVTGGARTFNTVALVEGIENMQIDYGLDVLLPAAPGAIDGSADLFTEGTVSNGAVAMTAEDWTNVVAVRIHLLARSLDPEAGYQDGKVYNLGLAGNTAATGDAFKRHVFSQLVRVVNPSGRREP